jgi:lipopolysaccharide/colanic/teichoic acid biosynthesis glycosyltransferase
MEFNEYESVHFKMSNDPRITKVGKFLRRTSLDELPQILNIFLGHMTIIGPRPFVRAEQDQLPIERLLVKPGLSCYWQIADTVKMPQDEQLELDYRYIRERSVMIDIKIIFATIMSVIKGSNT